MKKRKYLLAAIALLLVFGIGSTIAYLTDTATKTNTFTIGGVDIDLIETAWDSGYKENPTALVPGAEVTKDPVIKNTGDTPAYVFIKVVEPCVNSKKAFTYTPNSAWNVVTAGTCSGDTAAETVYSYGTMTSLAANASTPALFDNNKVTLNTQLTNTDIANLRARNATTHQVDMVLTGYGIQTEGVTGTPAEIFGNF